MKIYKRRGKTPLPLKLGTTWRSVKMERRVKNHTASRQYLQLHTSDIRMFATTVPVTPIRHATCIAGVSHGSAAEDAGLTDVTPAVW